MNRELLEVAAQLTLEVDAELGLGAAVLVADSAEHEAAHAAYLIVQAARRELHRLVHAEQRFTVACLRCGEAQAARAAVAHLDGVAPGADKGERDDFAFAGDLTAHQDVDLRSPIGEGIDHGGAVFVAEAEHAIVVVDQ